MAHQVVCRTRVDEPGRALEFTWSVGSSAFPTYALRDDLVEQFRDNTRVARDRLFDLVSLYQPAAADRDLPVLRRCCLDLAAAGRNLYSLIFAPEAQPQGVTKTVRRWLRGVTDSDEVQSLEIVSEGQPWFAPWNVVYDADPDEDLFLTGDPKSDGGVDLPAAVLRPFWGLRYNLCGGLPVEPLRRNRLPSRPDVLFVIDAVVRDALAQHKDDAGVSQQAKLLEFVAACEKTKARVATSREELRKALKKRPHLIYWLGHADPTHLALGDDKVSLADLGNFLRDSGDDDELSPPGGLVFLNACQTATSPDRGLGSFLKAFHDANFSGIIATEERTLDNVASPFGLEVMRSFLDERKPIGEVLRRLRGRYAPLGLLYGTYCPPDLQLRSEAAPAAALSVGQVWLGGATEGALLGGGCRQSGGAVIEQLAEAGASEAQDHEPPLPDEPYLPLATYGLEHRALFAGRDDDVERFARVLGRPDTRMIVLHGESGVGKSSFLNAGVIPYLDDGAIGYQFHAEDGKTGAVLFVRATNDPAGQVAEALADFAARPYRFTTPAGDERAVDLAAVLARALEIDGPVARPAVRAALLADPARLDRALGALASSVPFTLVLVIDQAEEMFTLANPDGSGLADRDRVLRMLSKVGEGRGDYKVIVSLRTEFYGRLIGSLRQGPNGATGIRDYLLADLDRDDLVAFVTRPTSDRPIDHAREVPRDRYGFRFAEGVPEALATELLRAGRKDGVLPLAQVICGQLWERVQARGWEPSARVVTHDDLAALGGFAGALRRHVEAQIALIVPAQAPTGAWFLQTAQSILPERFWTRETFERLMADLTSSQLDGTLTTALVSESDLASRYGRFEGISFSELLGRANSSRLLRTTVRRGDDGTEERSVSLGHDALARVAFPWKQELERRDERRKWSALGALAAAIVIAFAVLSWNLHLSNQKTELQRKQAVDAFKRESDARKETRRALDDSIAAHHEAEAINEFFLEKLIAQAKPENNPRGGKVTVEELLDRAAKEVEGSFPDWPLREAAIRQAIGRSYYYLGEYGKAERHLRRNLKIRRDFLNPEHPDTLHAIHNVALLLSSTNRTAEAEELYRGNLAARLRVLGPEHADTLLEGNNLAGVLHSVGKVDEAETLYRSNLEVCLRVLGPEHRWTLLATQGLARILSARGRLDEAEKMCRSNLDALRRVRGPDDPNTLSAISSLAHVLQARGKLAEAEQLFRDALGAYRRVYGSEQHQTLAATNNLASLLRARGSEKEADQLYLENFELTQTAQGIDHPDTLAATDTLARMLLDQGKLAEAEKLYRGNLAARTRVQGSEHNDTLRTLLDLANVLRLRRTYPESEMLHRKCLEARNRTSGPDDPATLTAMNNLAVLLQDRGKLDEAETLFRDTARRRRAEGPEHVDTLFAINNLANLLQVRGKLDEAIALRRGNLEGRIHSQGENHSDTLNERNALAWLLQQRGDLAEAETLFRRNLEARLQVSGPDHLSTLTATQILINFYTAHGRAALAVKVREESLNLLESKFGPDHPQTLRSRSYLAVNLRAAGRTTEAVALLESILKLQESKLGPGHADTFYTRYELLSAYESLGRWADAETLRRDVVAIRRTATEPGSQNLADALYWLGDNLVKQSKWSEAELALRECVAIRQGGIPDTWPPFGAMSLLGEAMSGEGRYAAAEPFVVRGYEGMKAREAKIEARYKSHFLAAEKRLVRFYEAWDKPAQANVWALKLRPGGPSRRRLRSTFSRTAGRGKGWESRRGG
jgi:tetratricopeptide (TPR) repeat protein